MNNETLVKDLCSRLPYGVKFKFRNDVKQLKGIDSVNTIFRLIFWNRNMAESAFLEDCKPILFTSITEPINVNGETFVPWEELYDSPFNEGRYYEEDFEQMNKALGDIVSAMYLPQWIIEKLNEWHINYRLSPNQFVGVTESNNPYR